MSDRQGNTNYSDYDDRGVNMNPDDIPLEPRKGSFAHDAWVVIRRLRTRGITVPELVEKIKAEKVRTSDASLHRAPRYRSRARARSTTCATWA